MRRLATFLTAWALVVSHQTAAWCALLIAEGVKRGYDDAGLRLLVALIGTWFLLGAAMAWAAPALAATLWAEALRRRLPPRRGLALHLLACVALGAALLWVVPALYRAVNPAGPQPDLFERRRLLFALLALEGGWAVGASTWWLSRASGSTAPLVPPRYRG